MGAPAGHAEPGREPAPPREPAVAARDVGPLGQLGATAGNAAVSRLLAPSGAPPPAPGAQPSGRRAGRSREHWLSPLQRVSAGAAVVPPAAASIGIVPPPTRQEGALPEVAGAVVGGIAAAPPGPEVADAVPGEVEPAPRGPEVAASSRAMRRDEVVGDHPPHDARPGEAEVVVDGDPASVAVSRLAPRADRPVTASPLARAPDAVDVDVAPARGPPEVPATTAGSEAPPHLGEATEPTTTSFGPAAAATGATGPPAAQPARATGTGATSFFSAVIDQDESEISGSEAPADDLSPATAAPVEVQRHEPRPAPAGPAGRDERPAPALEGPATAQQRPPPAVQRSRRAGSSGREASPSDGAAPGPLLAVSRAADLGDDGPLGPEPEPDENDVDTSEFSNDPRAEAALATIPKPRLAPPPPAPKGPPPPARPTQRPRPKSSPKPPKGPRAKTRPGRGGPGKGRGGIGEIVTRRVPPPPPPYRFRPGLSVPPPAPLDTRKPTQDPAFAAVASVGKKAVKDAKKHPTGKAESDASQLAAKAPANDTEAQAKAGHADTMASAKPKEFSADAFYAAVKAALDTTSPKNFEEAKKLDEKAEGMKSAVKGTVTSSKDEATGDVEAKANLPPDPSVAVAKPEAPLTKTEIADPPALKASGAMPAPVPSEQLDLRARPAEVDQDMADAGVSEEQLRESNEPEFTGALDAKKQGEEHAAKAPGQVRQAEAAILGKARGDAAAAEGTAVGGAKAKITETLGQNAAKKDATKQKDEQARKEVADNVNKIYDLTKREVDGILEGLDKKVDVAFEQGEARIRKEFTADWNRRLKAYKDRRYSGLRGKYRWVRDKFKGLPEAANKEYEASRTVYEAKMDKLARDLSTLVAAELNKATRRIEQGRREVATYVGGLKGELAKVGQEAAAELADKFDDLDAGVKDKFDDLASSISKRWSESRDAVNKEIEAAKEANKGLYDKIADAIDGVIRTVRNLKDLILNVISKAAAAIGDIIRAPIRFLGNFVSAIKQGVSRFSDNILVHLQKGLMDWLFGALNVQGLEAPEGFDVKSMIKLVLQVLGITWANLRASFVKHIGEPAVAALEKGSDIVKRVMTEGPGALGDMLLEKFADFEDMVLGRIKDFVVDKVIQEGIKFLLSMLSPASAFIKACKMIYDIVRWLIDNGSRIGELINTIIDSIVDIARGGVGGVPEKIEGVLARVLPLAIGFLGSIANLGGIGDKVRTIIDRVRSPLLKAMDKVVKAIVETTKPIWQGAKKLYDKGKKAYEAGKETVKAGITKVKTSVTSGARKITDKVKSLFKKQERPVTMAGKQHTLTATPNDRGRFVISMASREMLLSAKIDLALEDLERNRGTASTDTERSQVGRQITQLKRIRGIAHDLETAAQTAGNAQVLPTGAPPGFTEAMAKLAEEVELYGLEHNLRDITAATNAAVLVDLGLLSKFGLPLPSYLQAQKVADTTGTPFDIRASSLTAAKLLEQGAKPKPEEFKQKTLNEDDVLLGAPAEHLGKVAWFLPSRPDKAVTEKLMGEEGGRRVAERWWARWRWRKDEYYEYEPKMRKKLKTNQILIHERVGTAGGGILRDAVSGLPFAGDHDLYAIHGPRAPVREGLEPAPFRVQHGAHLDWPSLPEVVQRGGMTPAETEIYNIIVRSHAPGGQALLRINPKRPPTAVASTAVPQLPASEQSEDITGLVINAGPPLTGLAGLRATEARLRQEASALRSDDSPEGKQQRLDAALGAALAAVNRFAGKPVTKDVLDPILEPIQQRFGLKSLEPVEQNGKWAITGEVNPTKTLLTSADAGFVPLAGSTNTYEELDPNDWTDEGDSEIGEGASELTVLIEKKRNKKYLFKPAHQPGFKNKGGGIRPGTFPPRAQAAAGASILVGVPSPMVRLVKWGGKEGSLQTWAHPTLPTSFTMTLSSLSSKHPAVHAKVVASPTFKKLRADLSAFDYLIYNVDRKDDNFMVEVNNDDLVRIIAIDHDLCFPDTPTPALVHARNPKLPDRYTRTMVSRLRHLDQNRAGLLAVTRSIGTGAEAAAMLARVDLLIKDIDDKLARLGESGVYLD